MKKKTSKTKSLVVAKRGQPTKYKPEYCDEIRKFMGRGYSLSAFAGSTHCSRATIYEWERAIPEFSYAVKSARAMRVAYLEKSLLSAVDGPTVAARMFALRNACPDEWREKVAHKRPLLNLTVEIPGAEATRIYHEMMSHL